MRCEWLGHAGSETQTSVCDRPIRLIATDLDGTLLSRDGSVSARTRAALARLGGNGMHLVLVTGRPPRFVRRLVSSLGLECYAVCCNGALVYDLPHGGVMHHLTLAAATARALVAGLREAVPGVCFAVELGERFGWDHAYESLDSRYIDAGGTTADALRLCAEPVTKLIVRHPRLSPDALLPLVRAVAGATADATHSGAPFVELSASGVRKSLGLEAVCAKLAVHACDVLAFGDMPNDLALLGWAGWGVAVANAHPDVLRSADEVTLSNEEDGVALVLERLLVDH